MKLQNIDLLRFQEKIIFRKKAGQVFIHDPVRKKYLVQTPEEVVRQLVIQYLTAEKNYPANLMAVEKSLKINGLTKRFDLLVYNRDRKAFLLVECKAPSVPVSEATFFQIGIYNLPLRVPYLLVTNGIDSYCCEMDYEAETFTFLEEVPPYPALSSD
jgi:hypothetical protein